MGGKAGAEKISGALRTEGESLSETPSPHRVPSNQQTNQTKHKINNCGAEAREEEDRGSRTIVAQIFN